MPRHRSLNHKKFVKSVDWELMDRYIRQRVPAGLLLPAIIMDADYVDLLLDHLKKRGREDLSRDILEGFTRINDLGHKTMNLLVQATDLYGVPRSGNERAANLALRLCLDHPEAFQYAYDRYCLLASSATVREHPVEKSPGEFTGEKIEAFRKLVSEFYGRQEKGYEVAVRHYDDSPESILVVDRGSYYRIRAVWKDGRIDTITYRPADEDILVFNRNTSVLSIKAPHDKDRRNYLAAFRRAVIGDGAPAADPEAIYTLKPVQEGAFDFGGDENVVGVRLLAAKIRLSKKTSVFFTSGDLIGSLKSEFAGHSLNSGEMTHAKFQFRVILNGRQRRVNVEINPPNVTDLYKKAYAPIISGYLMKQKVKLR